VSASGTPEDLLLVAISRQGDGRSIAGLRVDGRGWVRLVTPRQEGILYPHHTLLSGRTQPRLLDRILVDADWPDHHPEQPENRLIEGTPWQLLERPARLPALRAVPAALEGSPALLGDTEGRLRSSRVRELPGASLALFSPGDLRFTVRDDHDLGRRRIRARFWWGGRAWSLPLQDDRYRRTLALRPEGDYPAAALGLRPDRPLYGAVALGLPFGGWCYKSVVSLFQLPFACLHEPAAPPPAPRTVRLREPALIVSPHRLQSKGSGID
jgi:hypothetical protein